MSFGTTGIPHGTQEDEAAARQFRLEICIDSLTSAIAAGPHLRSGDRFEVCGSLLAGGGTTPSIGLVKSIRREIPHVALMVMIRPRPGSFVYSSTEIDVMLADIEAAREAGAAGVVFGCLTRNGEVDVMATQRLVEAAKGMEVTFHRAFDVTPSWEQALDAIGSLGIRRVLTSGHARTALEGAAEIDAMTRHPTGVTILPGSGINAVTLADLKGRAPLLTEAHFSASSAVPRDVGETLERGEELGFGGAQIWTLDGEKVRAVRKLVDSW